MYAMVYGLLETLLSGHCHREDGMTMAGSSWVWVLSDVRMRCSSAAYSMTFA